MPPALAAARPPPVEAPARPTGRGDEPHLRAKFDLVLAFPWPSGHRIAGQARAAYMTMLSADAARQTLKCRRAAPSCCLLDKPRPGP